MILAFALISIKIKSNFPGAHTFPEIVLAKHGFVAHGIYLFFGIATNMMVGACLVLGGSQVVAAMTDMSVYAACFLIPLVVAAYVIVGGLRSTFIADYIHTVVLFVVIFVFGFLMYATSEEVGSPSRYYDLLVEAAEKMPIQSNAGGGSYLTFRSVDGLVFAMCLFASGFTTVWLDQAYWQRAIASRPETSVQAYILGGMAWYGMSLSRPRPLPERLTYRPCSSLDTLTIHLSLPGIPFGFATAMGLGCAALTSNPNFPTYPNPLSAEQNAAGLSAPATAIALLGKGGAVLMLILLFMAVTSSTSAELIAVSSLLTFDVYKTYISPNAPSRKLVQVSHYGIVIYALALAAFCSVLNKVGLNLTWLLTVLATIVGGGAWPVGLVLLWSKMSTAAVIHAPWIGLVSGLLAWFITTWKRTGEITIASTGEPRNGLAGNLCSCWVPLLAAVALSYAFPSKYTTTDARQIERANRIRGIAPLQGVSPPQEHTPTTSTTVHVDPEKKVVHEQQQQHDESDPRNTSQSGAVVLTGNELVDFLENTNIEPMDSEAVRRGTIIAWTANVVFDLFAYILVPFTLFGTGYVFSRSFFTGWVVVSFIWVWVSMVICVIYPVVESRSALKELSSGVWGDIKSLLGGKKARAASDEMTGS